MRPLRLATAWLLGAAAYAAVVFVLLLAAVLVTVAASGSLLDPDAGSTAFGGTMVAVVALLVLTPVAAGAVAGLTACGVYRWHTGMAWWKWSVVALGGPALLWLVLAGIAQATTGIAAQLQVNGQSYASPALGVLLVLLAVVTPAATGVLVGRVKNRRAATLQEAVWPGAAPSSATRHDDGTEVFAAPSGDARVNTMTGAVPRVTRGGRDTVAAVGAAVVVAFLVATAAVAAAPTVFAPAVADGYERVAAGTVSVDVPEGLTETGTLSPTWTYSWSSPEDAGSLQQIAVSGSPQDGFAELYITDMTGNVPTFEVLEQSADRVTFEYTGADGAAYHGVLRVTDRFAVLGTASTDVPLDGLEVSVDSAR